MTAQRKALGTAAPQTKALKGRARSHRLARLPLTLGCAPGYRSAPGQGLGYGLTRFCASLVLLLLAAQSPAQRFEPHQWPPPRELDQQLLERHGLRTITGRHITLITDLPASPEIDAVTHVFDAAVARWESYFDMRPGAADDWRVQACLIGDREAFLAARLMPEGGEDFPHGLSRGHELWLNEQQTDYYRRHLLLHEGTHSFMATRLGSCGPGWYMESMAELLGQHTWDSEKRGVTLGAMLPEGHDARALGRVGLLQDAFQNKQALTIPAVMKINNDQILPNVSYAWVWALAKFLDTHPRYQERFRRLPAHVLRLDFDDRFLRAYKNDWNDLQTEWRIFIATLEYGHDIQREAIEFQKGTPLASTATMTIDAARGWQSTRVLVEAGQPYRIRAAGRFTIAVEPDGEPIPCEAGGVTLDYHAGAPLGMLLAAIDARDAPAAKPTANPTGGFLRPLRIGRAQSFTPRVSGTLYLRVNDSPAQLGDNQGELRVRIAGHGP